MTPDVLEKGEGESCGFFTNRRNKRLFYHLSPVTEGAPLVVFCNPLLEEQITCQPLVASWLRYLAQHRFNALAFDYTGTGNSWGIYTSTPDTMMEDVADAVEWFRNRQQVGKLFLLGIRFGANIALRSAPNIGVSGVIGVEPVMDMKRYWNNLLRSNLVTQLSIHGKVVEDRKTLMERLRSGGRINLSGYDIDLEFADSVRRFHITAAERGGGESTSLFLRSRRELEHARELGFRILEVMAKPLCQENVYYDPYRIDLFRKTKWFLERRNSGADGDSADR